MFEEYQKQFSNEVYTAVGSYLFWRKLESGPATDAPLLSALNESPTSWIFMRHSLMINLIMTFGRIFDIDGDAASIDDLLKICIEEIDVFSKENLRSRKIKLFSGTEPEWLDQYIQESYEPIQADFHKLKPHVKAFRQVFDKIYKPIRHKIFAHSDKKYLGKTDELWEATSRSDIEEILDFLTDINSTIRDTYVDGSKPILAGRKIDKEFFESDMDKLFDRIKNT